MHEVPVEIAGNLIPVSVQINSDDAIPVEVSPSSGGGGGGLSNAAKDALLQIARKVVYVDAGGQTYYNALYEALYPLASISAVYTQSGTVYDTDSLDSLKTDLVVTATYGDGGTATVPAADYTLSGTLAVGTSTITVTYEGKTATFTVTVSAEPATLTSISAVYTQSGTVYDTDSLDSLKTDLVVTAHYSDSSSETVAAADYTLSGTLAEGTSTVTVTYEGETDTFTVTVTASSILPAGYTQYDYIINDTPALATMVDTGLSASYCASDYAHELDFLVESNIQSTSYGMYGARAQSGSDPQARVYWLRTSGGNKQWACNYNTVDTGWTHTIDYDVRYDSITADGKWTVNDTVWETMTGEYTPPSSNNIWLFGVNTGGTNSYSRAKYRLYKFKVWNESTNEVIAEFIPCENANNVPGFYDIVRETFYTASNSGNLRAGNDE